MVVTTKTDNLKPGQRFLFTETNNYDRELLGSFGVDLHGRPVHLRMLNTEGTDFSAPKEHVFLSCAEFRDLVVPTGDGRPHVIVK